MNLHEPQLAWLYWSLLLVAVWLVVYLLVRRKDHRKEMLLVSLWTSIFGLTEPLFVPAYWDPPSLFDLAHRTGFDLESFIFSFGIAGIAVVLYEWIFKTTRHNSFSERERHGLRHRYHIWAIISAPIIFIILYSLTNLNVIYSTTIGLMGGGFFTWYCRPDLKKKMIISAFLFTGLYFLYFLTLIAAYPGYVEQVWNLKAISGKLIMGIPLEEYMFAFSFGFLWSSIYEHIIWKKLS